MKILLAIALAGGAALAQAPSGGGMLAVVNQKEHSVVEVDPRTRALGRTVSVGVNGHEVALGPGGMLYVPIYGSAGVGRPGTDGSTIAVIDPRTWTVPRTIDLGKALRPHKPVFGADGTLYCTGELDNAVLVIDAAKGVVLSEVLTGQAESHMFALSRDGSRGYTANVGEGTVSVLDMQARKLLAVVPVAKRVQRIAVSVDGRWAFTSDTDAVAGGGGRVARIDTATNKVSAWIAVKGIPYVTEPTPDGKWLLVSETSEGKGLVEVVELATGKVVRGFALTSQAGGFLVHGDVAYMSLPLTGRVQVLNLKTWQMGEAIVLTPGVDGMAWVPGS